MKQFKLFPALLLAATLVVSCSKDDDDDYNTPPPPNTPQSTVVTASGNLTDALAQFRSLLGDSLNTTPGKTSGRREINWEGVPPANNHNNTFPFDFFNDKATPGNVNRKRGLEYATNTGIVFRIDSTSYSEIDASYANEFKAFSGKRLFAHANGTANDVLFKVPGTNTNAFVRGFGVVFSDVDDANSTSLEFYSGNKSLGKFTAPVRTDANGHSFLGVFFPNEKVTAVKIVMGNGILAAGTKDVSAGGTKDLVVMDDFFYSEPLAQN
jgi:hypothetical protein